jgi:conjugative relaxase-like TrwC/TraI family protein
MMRVTVLKAPKAGGVSAIVRYLDPGAPERSGPGGYYTETPDPQGRWWGSGCGAVGMAGAVEPEQLERMLEARHPLDGQRLGRGFGESSARAYDATFSAPKSVSLLWALSPDEHIRAEVIAAHDAAVEATLGWLEEHGCVTRRGKDGVHQVDAHGLTVALFRQHTSRMLDPQVHTHAVIWSKAQDPTGAWLALDARFLLKQQFTMSWLYDAALRVS